MLKIDRAKGVVLKPPNPLIIMNVCRQFVRRHTGPENLPGDPRPLFGLNFIQMLLYNVWGGGGGFMNSTSTLEKGKKEIDTNSI